LNAERSSWRPQWAVWSVGGRSHTPSFVSSLAQRSTGAGKADPSPQGPSPSRIFRHLDVSAKETAAESCEKANMPLPLVACDRRPEIRPSSTAAGLFRSPLLPGSGKWANEMFGQRSDDGGPAHGTLGGDGKGTSFRDRNAGCSGATRRRAWTAQMSVCAALTRSGVRISGGLVLSCGSAPPQTSVRPS
jgi:hypothetical protein